MCRWRRCCLSFRHNLTQGGVTDEGSDEATACGAGSGVGSGADADTGRPAASTTAIAVSG
ncbi:hypothetical protein GCM10012289_48040 [Nonomuraea cavernae]|uniref:Uncharacterized protein n=1 Tax=Nonomuraea cavernae TaxID=2045107 RepID=A0A917Z4A9_9ACTN|nr:hypothetical protein GCM10012289_48040 [Nonomuraea cavernae]